MHPLLPTPKASRQPRRKPWSNDHLKRQQADLLRLSVSRRTHYAYSSSLNSYLNFCTIHNIEINPTPQTLSLFITFTSFYISPRSVESYLSGICHELEPYYPAVRENRRSSLVRSTLKGALRKWSNNIRRKEALSTRQLDEMITTVGTESYDDKLFLALLLVGFFALLRLGEITIPDNKNLRDPRKEIRRTSLFRTSSAVGFQLPGNKTDAFFEGERIIIRANDGSPNPLPFILDYVAHHDAKFPLHTNLFVTSEGCPPSASWFTDRLHNLLPKEYSGHSLRAGGATWLASIGTPPNIIQAMGRWSSDTWQRYIRKHPVVVQALLSTSAH